MNPDNQLTLMSAIVYQHRRSSRFEESYRPNAKPLSVQWNGEIPLMWIRRASDQSGIDRRSRRSLDRGLPTEK